MATQLPTTRRAALAILGSTPALAIPVKARPLNRDDAIRQFEAAAERVKLCCARNDAAELSLSHANAVLHQHRHSIGFYFPEEAAEARLAHTRTAELRAAARDAEAAVERADRETSEALAALIAMPAPTGPALAAKIALAARVADLDDAAPYLIADARRLGGVA